MSDIVPEANHEVAFAQKFAQLLATERVSKAVQLLDGDRVTLPPCLVPVSAIHADESRQDRHTHNHKS